MIIKPKIRSNFFANAHPLGIEETLKTQFEEASMLAPFKGPTNVLIIGGSSGYGLASRITLALNGNANTVNVSIESEPKGNRTGSAGFWNNLYFKKFAKNTNKTHIDISADAFLSETKESVIKTLQETIGQIDLLVYSLAAPARVDETTGKTVRSSIKTIGDSVHGHTIDIAKKTIIPLTVEPAIAQEIEDTVFVMGGSDWKAWVDALDDAQMLSEGFKTISYTYIGGETTRPIYRGGTLGKAKEHLEHTAKIMNASLSQEYHGEALVASSKAVVTKASVFIPQMSIYASCVFDVMNEKGINETTVQHKHRLFYDMVYGKKRKTDAAGRIRIDHLEMREDVQEDTLSLMQTHKDDTLFTLDGTKQFLRETYTMNGFGYDTIDYEKPVDIEALLNKLD